ncbi:hypothetical protein [Azonexus sp.]|jgi:hypothetical protein|uniref:hypothetical protein n=1 Tax=Azonexus sp. TaxID=1872668 RepID=UPI00283AA578|nr:hypothetical protein [Azonexus sp.]
MSRQRPVTTRLIEAIRTAGFLTTVQLRELICVRCRNIPGLLSHEIASGLISTYLIPNQGRQGNVRVYKWLGDVVDAGQSKPERRATEYVSRHVNRKTTPRLCMCCGQQFPSAGSHNRMCNECRRQDVSPYAP